MFFFTLVLPKSQTIVNHGFVVNTGYLSLQLCSSLGVVAQSQETLLDDGRDMVATLRKEAPDNETSVVASPGRLDAVHEPLVGLGLLVEVDCVVERDHHGHIAKGNVVGNERRAQQKGVAHVRERHDVRQRVLNLARGPDPVPDPALRRRLLNVIA